jgi:magnesium-transporting ATPase (P-type)
MKYIKTYESFSVNENWLSNAWNWIKEKLSGWFNKLTGDVKKGAEYAMNWIKENSEMMEDVTQKLKQQDNSAIMKLWNWVKSFTGNEQQLQPILNESVEEESNSLLEKIARISGASLSLLILFAAPVAAFAGLLMSNGLLFLIGAVVSIIAWSLASVVSESNYKSPLDNDSFGSGW